MQHHIFKIVSSLLPAVILSCWPTQPEEPENYTGMRRISAKNHSVTMGATNVWAGPEEKPQLLVEFNYDYWMDTAEVTFKHYARLTGKTPAGYKGETGDSTLPVRHVSWFDAILFCNNRSIEEGLDTVYRYTAADQTADGRVYRMEGLSIDWKAKGYRLPTEAEWEYAAGSDAGTVFPWGDDPDTVAADAIAWSALNSGDEAHGVTLLTPNRFGLYDMFGNVMEWVNDYMGLYNSDTVANYTGPAFNSRDQRPVKGGGFSHGFEKLRAASRTDVYSTLSSTARRYIGFRCCIGSMTPQQGGNSTTNADSSNPVAYTAGDPASFLPGTIARLVYVNRTGQNSHLGFLDFRENPPKVSCYTDFTPVYTPTISPDGMWVAFSTRDEGAMDNSEVYIRRLDNAGSQLVKLDDTPAFIPRWWTDPADGSVWLVYTTSAVDNTSELWRTTMTRKVRIVNGLPSGTPETVEATGSYHGGLSADGRYIATGFSRLRVKDRQSGTEKILFTGPQNGKADGDTSQVCNVSIGPSVATADQTMFLDFGSGRTASTITGSTYFTHQIIFTGGFDGTVTGWYQCPDALVQWNYPEWSSHPEYAVATGMPVEAPQSNRDIYVLNLTGKVYTRVLEGVELIHPYLWIAPVQNGSSLNTDSLGLYNEPPTNAWQAEFAAKMPEFWKYHDSIEVLCVGSSRIQNAVAPAQLGSRFTYNFGYAGGGLKGISVLVEQYALKHCPRLKAVIMGMDICWYDYPGGDSTWIDIDNSKGYRYDRDHQFWSSGLPDGFVDLVNQADHPFDPVIVAQYGWVNAPSEGWGPEPPPWAAKWNWAYKPECDGNLQLVDTMVTLLSERGVHCIGILLPMSPGFNDTPVYGTYGPSHETAKKIVDGLFLVGEAQPYFHVHDFNKFGNHSFTADDAFNASHLSALGAAKVSDTLRVMLDSLIGN